MEEKRGRPANKTYQNVSRQKLHTKAGTVFPGQRIKLSQGDANMFGVKLVPVDAERDDS